MKRRKAREARKKEEGKGTEDEEVEEREREMKALIDLGWGDFYKEILRFKERERESVCD